MIDILDAPTANGRHNDVDLGETIVISRTAPDGGNPTAVAKCRVAIVGFAPSSCLLAPFGDKTWVPTNPESPSFIWGLNELYKVQGVLRADLWFDIHDRRDGDISMRDPESIKWLQNCPIPVYMQDHYPDIPNSIRYPREDVVRHFRTNYFTNTISYEIALACMIGRDAHGFVLDPDKAVGELHVYGVDMAQDAEAYSEYKEQRPSVEYFLGWARAIGIKVHLPAECDLLKASFMYGYEGTGRGIKAKMNARRAELQAQIDGLRAKAGEMIQQAQQMQFRATGLEGAVSDVNYWDRCWVFGSEPFSIGSTGDVIAAGDYFGRPKAGPVNTEPVKS